MIIIIIVIITIIIINTHLYGAQHKKPAVSALQEKYILKILKHT